MASADYYALAYDLLARYDAGASYDMLAASTGWQRGSVKQVISQARNGKIRPPCTIRSDGWTDDMDSALEAHWERENAHAIALRLSTAERVVTAWAVNARARRRGLVKPGSPTLWKTERMEARA